MTHSPNARAPDLSVTLSRIAAQYLTLIFHQHTEAKDVITSKSSSLCVMRSILLSDLIKFGFLTNFQQSSTSDFKKIVQWELS
jgi:hypothetical protein